MSVVMLICTLLVCTLQSSAFAEQTKGSLSHNPFSKPSILAVPKKVARIEPTVEEAFTLELTATLVSDDMPLVIAGGEMLSVGDEISGYRLISVGEGKALFLKNGKTHTFWLEGSGVEIEQ
ncbi:MAG: hypothetical protein KZQ88_08415 [Candidatus Thiodiazotropha sp. (ex Dulcina madagascariensis)]|nr:hypothetical protein [Candidatus Thiodiazotropha sp. (ex Dulcina madagascariensis)]MCU7925512.1 hypothetical protein [Candidatus Thiodiazotropha sp. (ex Dulcina madagascariensis)]